MKVVNLTPHEITLFGETINLKIPSSGVVRATTKRKIVQKITVESDFSSLISVSIEIPVIEIEHERPEGLPKELRDNEIYIVSRIAAESIKKYNLGIASRFFTLSNIVRDDYGRVIGARALSRIT